MAGWQNRIVGQGVKRADQFMANPANWRKHPQAQRDAMRGVLSELGWIGVVIENVRTGYLIDGHERVWAALKADNSDVPFVQVDLSPEEEAYALATFDPLGAMAQADAQALEAVLRDVQSADAAVQQMLAQMAEDAGIVPPDFEPVGIDEQGRLDQKKPVVCPECGHEFVPS